MLATLTGPIQASCLPRPTPPAQRTRTADPLPYRVWVEDPARWLCVAAFAAEADAALMCHQLQRRGQAVAFQHPAGVERL